MFTDDYEAKLEAKITQLQTELARSRAETQAAYSTCANTMVELRADAAKVIHALDCAVQTVDALISWMPEGLTLSPEVSGCKERLDNAMRAVMGGPRK